MSKEPLSFAGRSSLTRISVSGASDHFIVRNGSERPVRVWRRAGGLQCECGRAGCQHVSSLLMCGFVEPGTSERQAA